MKVWFQSPAKPAQLVLAWQAPDGVEDRRRWQVGMLDHQPACPQFRYFEGSEFEALNAGRSIEDMRRQGFVSFPAFDYTPGKIFTENVMSTFGRRLPPSTRSDFSKYLEYFSIPSDQAPTGLTLFALTEARLPGDGFSLVDPLDPDLVSGEVSFEIAGFRHEAGTSIPEVGQSLRLVPEPTNVHDKDAVQVFLGDHRIGYVNRIQAPVVGQWLNTREVECIVLRFNGRPGAPRAYALLRLSPRLNTLAA
ncbi:HIRAN domain-containing protein [Brevundimonas sp. G8]|uniref:HIRAN domain-containing protein n=1 Tax=Brevundimonas sp. G8 TaxID=1350776 RepID=UPI0012F0DAC7|nr:HIRAN domain-containing protein [Brevundimonas sp. G8]VXA90523.1 conserved hypothetical protein [Brevundimonas sp. G8]